MGRGSKAVGKAEKTLAAEKSGATCPKGHKLPHRTNRGRCTPVHCPGSAAGINAQGGQSAAEKGGLVRKARMAVIKQLGQEADEVIDTLIPGESDAAKTARMAAKAEKAGELVRLAQGIGRWAAAKAHFKVPDGLEGAAAEEWVSRRALMLSVDALAELERQLKLGDDTQRREAARDILDMNGMRKKESVGGANTPIIMLVNPNGGPVQVPWAQRAPIGSTAIIQPPKPEGDNQ